MTSHRIHCAEVWGGIDHIDRDIVTGGLTASVYSKSSDGSRGGDIYYFSVCGGDQLTRIALADVQGHGDGKKVLHHPEVGPLSMEFSGFAVDGRPDLNMVVYNPATPADADKVRSLVRAQGKASK